jgi:hypothetical protein
MSMTALPSVANQQLIQSSSVDERLNLALSPNSPLCNEERLQLMTQLFANTVRSVQTLEENSRHDNERIIALNGSVQNLSQECQNEREISEERGRRVEELEAIEANRVELEERKKAISERKELAVDLIKIEGQFKKMTIDYDRRSIVRYTSLVALPFFVLTGAIGGAVVGALPGTVAGMGLGVGTSVALDKKLAPNQEEVLGKAKALETKIYTLNVKMNSLHEKLDSFGLLKNEDKKINASTGQLSNSIYDFRHSLETWIKEQKRPYTPEELAQRAVEADEEYARSEYYIAQMYSNSSISTGGSVNYNIRDPRCMVPQPPIENPRAPDVDKLPIPTIPGVPVIPRLPPGLPVFSNASPSFGDQRILTPPTIGDPLVPCPGTFPPTPAPGGPLIPSGPRLPSGIPGGPFDHLS